MTDSRTLSTTAQVTTCILSLYTGFGRIFTIQDLWSTNRDPSTKLERPRRAKSDYSRTGLGKAHALLMKETPSVDSNSTKLMDTIRKVKGKRSTWQCCCAARNVSFDVGRNFRLPTNLLTCQGCLWKAAQQDLRPILVLTCLALSSTGIFHAPLALTVTLHRMEGWLEAAPHTGHV